jgi:hypothetical protein
MPTEIDLNDAKHLIATAENGKEYQFLLVREKPQYTAAAFEANPNLAAGDDLLFKSALIPDENGQAYVDLKPKAKEIGDKLKDPVTPVLGVVIGTGISAFGEKKALAQQFVIKKGAAIKLKGIRAFAEPSQWAAYHHAVCFIGMEITGPIREVVLDTEPKPYNVAPGAVGVFVPTAPGGMDPKTFVIGSLGDKHAPNAGCKHPAGMHGNYALWSRCFSDGHRTKISLPENEKHFTIGLYPRATGRCVLKVYGVGEYASIADQIEFGFNGNHPHPGD